MVTVLVAAGKDGSDFTRELSCVLGRHFDEDEFMLCDIESFKPTGSENIIIVYKQPQPAAFQTDSANAVVAIVDSSDEQLLCHVSNTRLPAITCGLKSRDTITLSSMSGESAVIDLRRGISCLDGSVAEPQEIPLRHQNTAENFLLMASAAILILSGNTESLKAGYI